MTTNDAASDFTATQAGGHERRARIETTVNSLIRERQEVLVAYGKLARLKSFDDLDFDDADDEQEEKRARASDVRTFLQLLMDYTALGHFEIYQRIIEGKERRQTVKEASDRVYPGIAQTTDKIVDFNDKYDRFAATDEELLTFDRDISEIGEVLAVRGELEDEILAALQKK
ncbi:MAG: Rsd/AlgQ family anti-sigma factor [Gammaproteobacteria bacterium]|nr:Rsd/AlgQ family anti-sigma factor [Gammaproteobacteria bacterium]